MTITEKVAYIKGLMEGLALDQAKPEAKLIAAIVDVLGEIAETVKDSEERVEYLEGYCDELDDDLAVLEDEVYGDDECDCCDCDDECDCDCCDCDDDCDCCDCEDCDEIICVECPACNEEVCLDDTMDFDNITCPACGETFSCDIEEEDESEE